MDAAVGARSRALRALLFATVTIVAGVLAHWTGSGMTASPVVVLAGFVLATVVGWRLLPRRRARSVVLSSIGLQLALHVGFAASMAVGGMRALSLVLCQSQHLGGVPVDAPPGFLAPQHGALAMLFGLQGIPMLLAHIAAGAVSGTWLYAVDRLARGLVAVVEAVVRSAMPATALAGARPLRTPRRRVARRDERGPAYLCNWVTGGCGRRGPPATASC